MTTTLFKNEESRARIENWYSVFRDALPFETTERTIDTSFGKTNVLIAGPADAPPIVVLHGAFMTSAHVLSEMNLLVERYRVYAVDVIGQSSKSADVRLDVKDDSHGKWLLQVADGLKLDRFTLYGASWGGFVSLQAAHLAPERVANLIALVPAGVVAGSAWTGLVETGFPMMMYLLFPNQKRLERVTSSIFSTPNEQWQKYLGEAMLGYRLSLAIPPLFQTFNYKGPVLTLACERDVQFPGAAVIARMKELAPQGESELFENCRHVPPFGMEFQERVMKRIDAFLRKS